MGGEGGEGGDGGVKEGHVGGEVRGEWMDESLKFVGR